ncbi:MAG: hypothetical protein WA461_09095 [Nitrososphaeraceae archaeon]
MNQGSRSATKDNLHSSFSSSFIFSNIFSILRDEDTLRIFLMISEDRQPKTGDFGSRKRFYERLSELKRAGLVYTKKDLSGGYQLTPLGTTINKGILTLREISNFKWSFQAIDALNETMPVEGRSKILKALIPNGNVRNLLLGNTKKQILR